MSLSTALKLKWSLTLRSGSYIQGKGALRRGDRYCHLGVLCDLLSKERRGTWSPSIPSAEQNDCFEFRKQSSWRELPVGLARSLGVSVDPKAVTNVGKILLLSRLNDYGTSFEDLAAIIDECEIS